MKSLPKTVPPVEIRFATPDEARTMGVRKIPPAVREKLRLIDIRDFDLNACGRHARSQHRPDWFDTCCASKKK